MPHPRKFRIACYARIARFDSAAPCQYRCVSAVHPVCVYRKGKSHVQDEDGELMNSRMLVVLFDFVYTIYCWLSTQRNLKYANVTQANWNSSTSCVCLWFFKPNSLKYGVNLLMHSIYRPFPINERTWYLSWLLRTQIMSNNKVSQQTWKLK